MRKHKDSKTIAAWICATMLVVIAITLIAPPALKQLRAMMAEGVATNEERARTRLSKISYAEYSFNDSTGRYGTLKELCDNGFLTLSDESRFEGDLLVEHGYRFGVLLEPDQITNKERFQCAAWPEESGFSNGKKSFYYSHSTFNVEEYSDVGLIPAAFRK